MMVDQLLFIDT